GLPVLIVNDINAIAVGYAGSVQTGVQDLVYLHVENNGIGAGIIINGRLYSGFTSFAGEIGYMQVASGKKAEDMLTNSSPAQRTALLGAIAANIICVLNPEKMVIGGKDIPDSLYEHVQKGSFMQLPEEIMPQIVIIDSNLDFYFQGLGEMGKKLLDKDIHLA
ncbi:MAG: ROK family protein, partial [Lachnospiraceae bacterium]|nr:ROK family protein [Lachnospiraceae bacterium]